MSQWNLIIMGLIYQVYGLAFFVLGIVVLLLPKQNRVFHFTQHLKLLAIFGILHGLMEFVELQRLYSAALWLNALSRSLLVLSYVALLEFALRTWNAVFALQKLNKRLLYAASGLGVLLLTLCADDKWFGISVGSRFFIGALGALLLGCALFGQRAQLLLKRPEQATFWLTVVAGAFIGYGVLTLFLSHGDTTLPAWLPTQYDFLQWFGIPVQLLRAACALAMTIGFTVLIRQVGASSHIDATAFESHEAIVITDADTTILRVNKAFIEATGFSLDEVIGQRMSFFKSGYHDEAFYDNLWQSVNEKGTWQGEIWDRRKDGGIYPKWLIITAVKNNAGKISHYVGTHVDITERKAAEDEIKHLAFYDPLTRLPNRRLLRDRLQQALTSSTRTGLYGAVLFIDLDNFKSLNDTLGHDVGDLLLQQVAVRLCSAVRARDTVARLGGDEFVLMLEELSEQPQEAAIRAEIVGEKILTTLNEVYYLRDHAHCSTPSIGATLFIGHEKSLDELLKQADIAMYQAKAAGRNTLRFFDPSMQEAVSMRVELEDQLRQGLEKQQFILYYQTQVNALGDIIGAEALVRWQHPQRGLLLPEEFIGLAEETGLILPLGQWVLVSACEQLALWAKNPQTSAWSLAVNISIRQFYHDSFIEQILHALERSRADAHKLKLEVTESLLMHNINHVTAKMQQLKLLGIRFSLDDFGTGYSSLFYLKNLPLDQLKIDQSFVRDGFTNANDAAIASVIITMANILGLSIIAEGVETPAQHQFLTKHGCNVFQGYLFGRPMPINTLPTFPAQG